jgi:hypothetical protein
MPDIDRTIATDSQATAGRNLFADQDTTADVRAVGSPGESGSVDQALGPTPDGDTTETAAESAAIDLSRVEVTFRHASGGAPAARSQRCSGWRAAPRVLGARGRERAQRGMDPSLGCRRGVWRPGRPVARS